MTTIKKAICYARVSTNKQVDNTSIDNQLEKINLYCKLNEIEILKTFKDEGFSAKSTERKQYQKMMQFINEHEEVDAIIVMKSDRIHRSLKNLVDMMYMLQDKKIEFVSVTENFDTSTAQGMLMLQMLGSFSEFERKVIAERTRSGRIANINKEYYPGGRPPYGYYVSDKKLKINKKQAKTVKEMFKRRIRGETFEQIGEAFGFSKQTVSNIIKNKVYMGEKVYNGAKEKNNYTWKVEQIVTKYTYNKANNTK